jgi:hypothetical protein
MVWEPNKWRQGYLVSSSCLPESVRTLGVSYYIVISHDCDLARDEETDSVVELLPCYPTEPNHLYLHAQHPRKLHIITVEAVAQYFEIRAYDKLIVKKNDFIGVPSGLIIHDLIILRSWLVARYRRQALPDILDNTLKPFWKKFRKISKNVAESLHGVWVNFESSVESGNDTDCYNFLCYFVYDTDKDPDGSKTQTLVNILKDNFEDELSRATIPIFLELYHIADTQFDYRTQMRTTRWVHDYISYSAGISVEDE